MISIAILGNKGGISKTTNAVNLAAAAARRGLRVLLVDTDGQGSATRTVGLQPVDAFKALIVDDAEFADVIQMAPLEFAGAPLAVIGASVGQRIVGADPQTPGRIYERFQELRGVFDLVVFDTSPSVSETHAAVMFVCDFVLLPVTLDEAAVAGLEVTRQFLQQAARAGVHAGYPSAAPLGVVVNQARLGEQLEQQFYRWLIETYGSLVIRDPLRYMGVWKQAGAMRRSIYEWSPEDSFGARRWAPVAAREFDAAVWAPVAQVMGVRS